MNTLQFWVGPSESRDVTWKSRSSAGIKEPRLDVEAAAGDVTEYGDVG